MKIIRYLDAGGATGFAALQADGSHLAIEGDIYHSPRLASRRVLPVKLLAPVEPRVILCIGLNYKRHAAESGLPEPPIEAETRDKLAELAQLERALGTAGVLALRPLMMATGKEIWQLTLLRR